VLDERVFHAGVSDAVRTTIVLGLDDDGTELAKLAFKIQHVSDNGNVLAPSTDVADQNGKPAAFVQCPEAANQADAKCGQESRIIGDGAEVHDLVAVPDDVPIRRMNPDEVETARHVLKQKVESLPQVATPILDVGSVVVIQPCNHVSGRTGAFHRVRYALRSVPQDEVLDEVAVTIPTVARISPKRASFRMRAD